MNEDEIKKRTIEISAAVLRAVSMLMVQGLNYKEGIIASKCMVALLSEVDRNPRVSEVALAEEARSWVAAELRKI